MSAILNNEISREVARIVLKAKYPNLTMVEERGDGLTVAAKNIRAELKAAYPDVKFSVRVERFSMGDAIRVGWTDGPNVAQIDAITDKYKAGSFDGQTDSYDYRHSDWKDAFGDAKYISTHRTYSDSLVASAIGRVANKYGAEPIAVEDYRSGAAWRWMVTGCNVPLGEELNRYLHKLSRALPVNKHHDAKHSEQASVADKPNKRAANYNKSPGRAVRMARAARSAMKRGYF